MSFLGCWPVPSLGGSHTLGHCPSFREILGRKFGPVWGERGVGDGGDRAGDVGGWGGPWGKGEGEQGDGQRGPGGKA